MSDTGRPTLRGSPLGSPDDPESAARAVRSMFAAVAPRYDFLNHFLSLGFDVAWRRATASALRHVLVRRGSLALDVCCGTGDLALALRRVSAGRVVATDFCRPMVQRAQFKARHRVVTVCFLEADTLALPFRDSTLDVVSVGFGLRNLADYTGGLREMWRVLKPGGFLAILEFSRVAWPVFGPVFRFYFHRILPWIGTLISGIPGPYQYLPDSVSQFPAQESLAAILRDVGFTNVGYRNFSGGVAALHLGQKA